MQAERTYRQIAAGLEALRMTTARQVLDNALEPARLDQLTPLDVLDRLLAAELAARHERRVETNLEFAGLPYRMHLDDFDFHAHASIDPLLVGRLATLRFLDEGTHVLRIGLPSVGKTALAVGLAIEALEVGHRIFFISCHDFVGRFRRAVRMERQDRLRTTLLRRRPLIPDEIGGTPLDRDEPTFLFEVVAKRFDREEPIIVTSNKSWGACGEVLPDEVMIAAILDGLLHRSHVLNIRGRSYRLRDLEQAVGPRV